VDALIRDNTFVHNGQIGLQGDNALRPVVIGNDLSSNNTEHFTPISASGGLKFTATQYATIRNNSAIGNNSHGIWLDMFSNHAVMTGNYAQGNNGGQIYFEYSDDAVIANNVAVGGPVGILSSRSTNFDIWNNTVYKSEIGIKFQRGDRGGDGRIENNVVATEPNNLGIAVQDVNHVLNGHDMNVRSNYNAYYRRYSSSSDTWGWWANWPAWELHAANIGEYRQYSGDEWQSLSVENNPTDPFITNADGGDYRLPWGSPARNAGAPLSARVASALGRPAGQRVSMGFLG
jgi:parallel beta-helix repeat protein